MLDERKLKILEAIINSYVKHGEPVGSRSLSKNYDLGVSSATIRNEMSDLEDLGLLNKPHTSSGRVPSEMAYRFYVDYLHQSRNNLTRSQIRKIRERLEPEAYEEESLIRTSLKILSELTNYTMLLLSDDYHEHKIQLLKLISLNRRQVVLLILSDNGNSESFVITLDKPMDILEVSLVEDTLNCFCTQMDDMNPNDVWDSMMTQADPKIREHLLEFKPYIVGVLSKNHVYNLHSYGLTNLLNYPDYQDPEHLKQLMRLLVEEDEIAKVLDSAEKNNDGVTTQIGSEINHELMKDSSIISSQLMIHGVPIGRLALVGPVRMDYGALINTLWSFSNLLNKL